MFYYLLCMRVFHINIKVIVCGTKWNSKSPKRRSNVVWDTLKLVTCCFFIVTFNKSDGTNFRLDVLVWYPLLKMCQFSPNFWKSVLISSLSDKNY